MPLHSSVVNNRLVVLQGAETVVLDGVYHSMSKVGNYTEAGRHIWYGSPEVIDLWAHHLVP